MSDTENITRALGPHDPEMQTPPSNLPLGDPLVRKKHAQKRCGGVSDMTWWRWEQRYPELRAVIIGGRKYYRESVLEAFITAREA